MTGFFGFILRINRPFDKTYLSLQQKQHLCLILLLIIRLKESKVFRNIAVHKSSYPMNAIYTLTCTIILSVVAPLLRAQTVPSFLHLNTPGYDVRTVCQDSTGMIWLGTSTGLKNYIDLQNNGYFMHPIRQKLGMPIRQVQCDAEGRLWIWTDQMRLLAYNPRTGEFVEDAVSILQSWGMAVWYNFDLLVDGKGRVWTWKDERVYCYHPLTGELRQLTLDEKEEDLGQPRHNWCAKGNRMYLAIAGYLYQLDADAMRVVSKEPFPFDEFPAWPNLFSDSQGNVWLGMGNQVYYRNAHTGIWNLPYKLDSYADKIVQLDEQTVCVSTLSSGIYLFGMDGRCCQVCRHDALDEGSLLSDHISGLYVDRSGCLYVNYSKRGLSIYHPGYEGSHVRHLASLKSRLIADDILCFAMKPDGTLLVGTDGYGIRRLDSKGKETGKPLLDGEAIVAMHLDAQGRLWAGTFQEGLYCEVQGKMKRYLDNHSCYSLGEDAQGKVYVGTLGSGFYRIDPETDEVVRIPLLSGGQYIMDLERGVDGLLYAATTDGVLVVNPVTLQTDLYKEMHIGTDSVLWVSSKSVVCDRRGWVWVLRDCGGSMVSVWNLQGNFVMDIPELSGYNITAMVEDADGNLWMSSDKGLVQVKVVFSPQGNPLFRIFNYRMHATPEYNNRAAARLPGNTLAFGCIDGYQLVYPRELEALYVERRDTLAPCFSTLSINNVPVLPGDTVGGRVLLSQSIRFTRHLELEYDENNLVLTLSPQDYGMPFKGVYAYRLSPLDEDFHPVEGYTLSLNNLPPGKYQLYVKEQNASLDRKAEMPSMDFVIHPPFWKSKTAYTGYILLFMLVVTYIIYYVYKWQRYKMRLKQVELEAERQYQINEMKLRFFTNVSHDFRTPLSLIIMPLSDFLEHTKDEKMKKFLTPVHRNALRLLTLVNQILDFRKLEVYGQTLNPSYGDIVSFMRDVCSSFTLMADDVHCDLQFRSAVDRVEMLFDKDKVTKIMMNLLSNAFKYTPAEGCITVSLEVWNTDLQVKVADTGQGIPDADKERVFDRFYQAAPADNNRTGSGIGLHIVKEFVKLHKGEITVTDNEPHGAIFCFTIPIQKAAQSVSLMESLRENEEDKEDASLSPTEGEGKKTLLLVEDNPDFLSYMAHTLSDEHRILQAHNGKEALEVLEQQVVDVVISDIMMNEMDGLTLCRTIKSRIETSHIPVILLTAKVMEEDEVKGFEMGADDYITKPFNVSILRHRIHGLIERSRRSHERFKNELEVKPSEITITSLDEQLLARAIKLVEDNMENPDFSVQLLSAELGMHRSNCYHKILSITGKTPVEFIRLIRLKRAIQLLEKSQLYISEVATKVGFNSPRLFAKYFKEEFGVSPREYLKSRQEEM